MNVNVDYCSIQDDVVAYLTTDPFFAHVFIFSVKPRSLATQVSQALSGHKLTNGKAGASIEVGKPFLVDPDPNSPGPNAFIEMRFLVKVQPTINDGANGTKLSAEAIDAHLIQSLMGWASEGAQSGPFFPPADVSTPAHFGDDVAFEGRLVKMRAGITFTPLQRTATPQLTETGPLQIAIACGSPDAAAVILYTTDGSTPGYQQGKTVPAGTTKSYAAPFNVADGTIVRAIAIADGKLPSDINYSIINA